MIAFVIVIHIILLIIVIINIVIILILILIVIVSYTSPLMFWQRYSRAPSATRSLMLAARSSLKVTTHSACYASPYDGGDPESKQYLDLNHSQCMLIHVALCTRPLMMGVTPESKQNLDFTIHIIFFGVLVLVYVCMCVCVEEL